MTTAELRALLEEALASAPIDELDDFQTRTFADAGLMTRDEGLEIMTSDGDVFQVTIVRAR